MGVVHCRILLLILVRRRYSPYHICTFPANGICIRTVKHKNQAHALHTVHLTRRCGTCFHNRGLHTCMSYNTLNCHFSMCFTLPRIAVSAGKHLPVYLTFPSNVLTWVAHNSKHPKTVGDYWYTYGIMSAEYTTRITDVTLPSVGNVFACTVRTLGGVHKYLVIVTIKFTCKLLLAIVLLYTGNR